MVDEPTPVELMTMEQLRDENLKLHMSNQKLMTELGIIAMDLGVQPSMKAVRERIAQLLAEVK